jgi:hypothetical protein
MVVACGVFRVENLRILNVDMQSDVASRMKSCNTINEAITEVDWRHQEVSLTCVLFAVGM